MMKQKTLQTQYNLIKEGKGNKEVFLKEAKRIFPNYIPNAATFNQAEVILSQKSIISETVWGVTTGRDEKPDWFAIFNDNMKTINEEVKEGDKLKMAYKGSRVHGKTGTVTNVIKEKDLVTVDFGNDDVLTYRGSRIKNGEILAEGKILNEEAKAVEKKASKEVTDLEEKNFDYKDKKNIDNVYGEQFLKGYYCEMKNPKNEEKTVEELKSIVAKNLAKDQLHYVKAGQFGEEGVGYTDELPGLKASKSDQMEKVKLKEGFRVEYKTEDGEKAKSRVFDKKEDAEKKEKQLVDKGIKQAKVVKLDEINFIDSEYQGEKDRLEGDELYTYLVDTMAISRGEDDFIRKISYGLTDETSSLSLEDVQKLRTWYQENLGEVSESTTPSLLDLIGESYDEFQRDDKGAKDVTAKDKGEEDAYGAGVKKGEEIEKSKKKKKVKKETIESKLAEIDKASNIVALEAKINAIAEMIESKSQRLEMVNEDSDLAEMMDKAKIKAIQKEIKELEKRKSKMEKLYEKSCGKKYQQQEIVDETQIEEDRKAKEYVMSIEDEDEREEERERMFGSDDKISEEKGEFKKGDKVTYLGHPGIITHVHTSKSFINPATEYNVEYDKGNGPTVARTRADSLKRA